MALAKAACRARRLRLTPARAFVLEVLLEAHKALTAYELLKRLAAAGLGSQPPVAYRALDFLLQHGFVHRIERIGGYVACSRGDVEHRAAFFVCRLCRTVAETSLGDGVVPLLEGAEASGFVVERTVVEVEGLCARCRAVSA